MKQFIWNDAWSGEDKFLHFFLCYVLVGVLSFFMPVLIAYFTTLGVALLKEVVYDMILEKGTPSLQDFLVSLLGALLGLGMLW